MISGKFKGTSLFTPKGNHTRPTTDQMKESIFNILGPLDDEAVVLDAFAGSGAIGIEFFSRGVKQVYFIENNRSAWESLQRNLEKLHIKSEVKSYRTDTIKALKRFAKEGITFDYIYLDPPYEKKLLYEKALNLIAEYELLREDGLVILESHTRGFEFKGELFKVSDRRPYGDHIIYFLERRVGS